jgi:23S rRNA (pseudouridine1915-N3)-methyltransferase
MRIKICWVGKTQNAPIRSLLADYLERLRHLTPVATVEVADLSKRKGLRGAALMAAEAATLARAFTPECRKVVLDERGRQFTSREFARWMESEQVRGTREIAFVIGGQEGVDRKLAEQAHLRLSLGPMTWTHEMARVLLVEQLYRALCIVRNIPYHK